MEQEPNAERDADAAAVARVLGALAAGRDPGALAIAAAVDRHYRIYDYASISACSVLEAAREVYGDRHDLEDLADEAARHVARKHESPEWEMVRHWAVEVMADLAAEAGRPLFPIAA